MELDAVAAVRVQVESHLDHAGRPRRTAGLIEQKAMPSRLTNSVRRRDRTCRAPLETDRPGSGCAEAKSPRRGESGRLQKRGRSVVEHGDVPCELSGRRRIGRAVAVQWSKAPGAETRLGRSKGAKASRASLNVSSSVVDLDIDEFAVRCGRRFQAVHRRRMRATRAWGGTCGRVELAGVRPSG